MTSTISVMLVLFIIGLVGALNTTFHGINRQIKEKMGFTVVLADSVGDSGVDSLKILCDNAPYISDYKYLSAEEVMAEETKEEKAEQEEALKEAQAEQEKRMKELEEEMEKRRKNREARTAVNSMPSLDTSQMETMQRQFMDGLQQILDEQALMPEEIKGIVVDLNL